MTKTISISDYCTIEKTDSGISIGTDMHMNGMDSPASVDLIRDLKLLIESLTSILKEWEEEPEDL